MEIAIRAAETPVDHAHIRALMSAYGAHLAASPSGAANICLQDYDRELALLPGPYAAPGGVLFLAAGDAQPAGCVAFKPVRSTSATGPNERACEMKRLWVDPAFRGHQLGRRLIAEGVAWARRSGYTAIYLDTVPAAMPQANALYQLLGFESVPRYNDNPVADLAYFRLVLT